MISKRNLLRISTFILTLVLLLSMIVTAPITASAADPTKKQKSYEIAVAFDNSYSMYIKNDIVDGNNKKVGETDGKAWSRAKYAMEIFASMLDYDNGDRLTIFPMWQVVTDGSQPMGNYPKDKVESKNPITISKKEDIDYISKMYTVYPYTTPFTPVDKAADFLKSSDKDEKWLIVLTDGSFDGISDANSLQNELAAYAGKSGIKVQYLGLGAALQLQSTPNSGFYADTAQDTDLKDKLIKICNAIFKRDELPRKYINGNTVNFDISMKKVLVFVQGEGAQINSLKDSSGKSIPVLLNSGQRKFSTISEGRRDNGAVAPYDDTLYGQVVTFDACQKGEYTLDFTGSADALQIFYEPNVDIEVTLTDSDGNVITKDSGEIYAGDYKITSKIIDAETLEDVTNHELMGGNVSLKTYVETSNNPTPKEFENGATITLEPDSDTTIYVEGKYLEDYTISTKDNPDFDWISHIKVQEEPVKLQLTAECLQDGSYYLFKDFENWKPIKVSMLLEGQPLTDAQLEATEVAASCDKDIKLRTEKIPGESAFYIYPAQDANGKFIAPEKGTYKIKASATFTDELGVKNSGQTDKPVKIEFGSILRWIKILLTILFWLIILALIIAWLIHPVLPKEATIEYGSKNIPNRYADFKGSFVITAKSDQFAPVISGRPKTIFEPRNFWVNAVLFGKREYQSFELVDLKFSDITSLSFGTDKGVIKNGVWLDSAKEPIMSIRIEDGDMISWNGEPPDRKGRPVGTVKATIKLD